MKEAERRHHSKVSHFGGGTYETAPLNRTGGDTIATTDRGGRGKVFQFHKQ